MNQRNAGITRLELIVVLVLAALAACLLPTLVVPLTLPNRAICSANVRGIIQSMSIYAQSSQGQFPCTPGPQKNMYSNAPQAPLNLPDACTAKAVTAAWFGNGNPPHGSDCGDPLASIWLLVLEGQDTPKSYICPSDPIAITPSLEYQTGGTQNNPLFQPNFGVMKNGHPPESNGNGESYSFAYPWRPTSAGKIAQVGSWWTNHDGSHIALVSDMAPADIPGRGQENRITTTLPGNNTFGNYIYNSMNHGGKGENVGFGDDHVDWETNPYCGVRHDNIFTYYHQAFSGSGYSTTAPQTGLSALGDDASAPTIFASHNSGDICMVPVRNGSAQTPSPRRW